MHELSVCQAMLDQVALIADRHRARGVSNIIVRIGPLSGVEPDLLAQAFPIARAGTIAEDAKLVIESMPIRVRCDRCGAESEVEANRLLCRQCGGHRTRVISGDELLLASVELIKNQMQDTKCEARR